MFRYFALMAVLVLGLVAQQNVDDFFSILTPDQRQQFLAIHNNRNLTRSQLAQQLHQWAANAGGVAETQYNFIVGAMHKLSAESRQNRSRVIQQLPTAVHQIESIINDDDISAKQEMERVQQVLQNLHDPQLAQVTATLIMQTSCPLQALKAMATMSKQTACTVMDIATMRH